MSTTNKNQEKDESFEAGSDDDFQFEELSVEDNWSLTEREEDLEATLKAIQARAEAAAAPRPTSTTHQTEDRFLRNFLSHMGMRETLDCFQTEWAEMVQRGLVDTERVGVVPDVYVENQRLESELRSAQREQEEYRLTASTAAETLVRVQRDRDFHRMHHKRVVQERNRLTEEIRKLKVQCSNYEPAVKRMNEKCQAVLKQTMLVTLGRDKVIGQANTLSQSDQLKHPRSRDAGEEGGTSLPAIQPRPPTSAKSPRSQTKGKANSC